MPKRVRQYDEDGLCITHGQKMYLEPCYACIREDFEDLKTGIKDAHALIIELTSTMVQA